jgi:hypothetical protein
MVEVCGGSEGFWNLRAEKADGKFEIGRILHLKFEIRNLRMDLLACGIWVVHSEISSFEFEMPGFVQFQNSLAWALLYP